MENEKPLKTFKRKPKILISLSVDEEIYQEIKERNFKYSYVFIEGLKYLTGRCQTNQIIKEGEEELKKTNEKLFKVNSILQNQIFKLQEDIYKLKGGA